MKIPRNRRITVDDLTRYLFGDPLTDPKDTGIMGRLTATVERNTHQVNRLLTLGWVILIMLVTAVLALASDVLIRLTETHLPGGGP